MVNTVPFIGQKADIVSLPAAAVTIPSQEHFSGLKQLLNQKCLFPYELAKFTLEIFF